MTATNTYVLIDGQNFYKSAKSCLGIQVPSFDPKKVADLLSHRVSNAPAAEVRFYTGMASKRYNPKWFHFWGNKIQAMEDDGIKVSTTELRYTIETNPGTKQFNILGVREKGIDMLIGLDAMEVARRPDCENIIIASRDQDFKIAISRIKMMCDFERRDIGLFSAFPADENTPEHIRGIEGTEELRVSRADYDRCVDHRNFFGESANSNMYTPSF